MATTTETREATRAGVTLVARYKGTDYTCEVVAHEGKLRFVLPGRGQDKLTVFGSPSAAGKAVTGSAVNGWRLWSVPEAAPSGQAARQKAAKAAVEKAVAADAG